MTKIGLTLKTVDGNVDFDVVKINGKFHVFNKIVDLNGKKKSLRIGEATTWQDVVVITKIYTGKEVLNIKKAVVLNN